MSKPVHTSKAGRVHLAIWKNTRDGGPPYDLTLSRRYQVDEEWKTSYTFSAYDLENLEKALAAAREFVEAEK